MNTPSKRRDKNKAKNRTRAVRQRLTIVKPEYREQYKENGFNGINNGDAVAEAFAREKTDIERVAQDNQIDISKWAHLGAGHRRMCLGNRLRGMVRHGNTVKIGHETINRV